MGERRLLSIATQDQLRQILKYMLDEREFLSPYGIRALSQVHRDHPYHAIGEWHGPPRGLRAGGIQHRTVRRQLQLARPDLVSGQLLAHRVAAEVSLLPRRQFQGRMPHRLRQDDDALGGRRGNFAAADADLPARCRSDDRPVFGGTEKFQNDPHWRDLIPFHEYFHGDNGAGIGASHQTGWTGLVAKLIQQYHQ